MSLVTQTGCNNKPRERRVISAFSCIKDGWKKKTRKISLAAAVSRTLNYTSWLQRSRLYNIWHPISGQKRKKKKEPDDHNASQKDLFTFVCLWLSTLLWRGGFDFRIPSLFNTFVSVCVGILGWQEERTDFHVSDGWLLLSQRKSQSRSKSMSSRTAAAGQHNLQINHFYFYFISF